MQRADLQEAVRAGILSGEQADRLAEFLSKGRAPAQPDAPRFTFVYVLYYLGGMIAIGAMSLFMTLGWNAFGGWGGFAIACLYLALALLLTHWFLSRNLPVPAGIMATLAVTMVPLAVFSAQMAFGHWSADKPFRDYHVFIDWRWIMMEFATLAAGLALLWRYRFPFMLMPIAVTLWYMSMDLVPFLFGDWRNWEVRKFISLWFGLAMVLVAFWVDLRSRFSKDYAFWLYLFGVLTFWGGLSSMNSGSAYGKALYCAINVGMVLVGAILGRRVFAVFGGLGIAGYLSWLSWSVFRHSILFPFALSALGIGIIWLGVLWSRREAAWAGTLRGMLPVPLRELIEARAVR